MLENDNTIGNTKSSWIFVKNHMQNSCGCAIIELKYESGIAFGHMIFLSGKQVILLISFITFPLCALSFKQEFEMFTLVDLVPGKNSLFHFICCCVTNYPQWVKGSRRYRLSVME